MNRKNIGELLLEYGIITQEDIEQALLIQEEKGLRIGEALIYMEKVTEYDIEYILSVQLNIPYVLIDDLVLDNKLIRKFPADFLLINSILPIYETDSEIAIVTDDPFNQDAFDKVANISGKKIQLSCGSGSKISKELNDLLCQYDGVALVTEIEPIVAKIKGSSFYRLDFNMNNTSCDIYIYGCGLFEDVKSIKTKITIDDIFNSFNLLKLPFYYFIPEENEEKFISIYPIDSELLPSYPMTVSTFGLVGLKNIHFSDLKSRNIPNALYSDTPVEGYPYFSFKKWVDYQLGINLLNK